jgi:hypothetical protein
VSTAIKACELVLGSDRWTVALPCALLMTVASTVLQSDRPWMSRMTYSVFGLCFSMWTVASTVLSPGALMMAKPNWLAVPLTTPDPSQKAFPAGPSRSNLCAPSLPPDVFADESCLFEPVTVVPLDDRLELPAGDVFHVAWLP